MSKADNMESAIKEVMDELIVAMEKHPSMRSPHEGFAILNEEVDELWDEIRRPQDIHDRERMREECVQVAAMAIRFMVDLTEVRK